MILIMMGLGFLCEKNNFTRLKQETNIWITVYCYKNKLVFPIYVSDQEFENSMDLLFVTDENKSHYAYIKDFDILMFYKTE